MHIHGCNYGWACPETPRRVAQSNYSRYDRQNRKKTSLRPRNSYIAQIKRDIRVKNFNNKELKDKVNNLSEWRIRVID